MESKDLDKIKKYYGEDFAHYCRVFSTILDTATEENPTPLFNLLSSYFYPNKSLLEDLVEQNKLEQFKKYIYNKFKLNNLDNSGTSLENPFDLMKKAGYTLYKCETYKDTLKFKKYYKNKEEICTFKDPERTKSHLVFFAIKDGTTENGINGKTREDFINPKRQDEYGTSVISIQFLKGKYNILSIKNRYNHAVINPDATFSNNLDNICFGLTNSFTRTYELKLIDINSDFYLENYSKINDKKFFKYNYLFQESYLCPDNTIVYQSSVRNLDKGRYELIDYFLIDKKNKTIESLLNFNDSFVNDLQNFKKLEIVRENDTRKLIITKKDNNIATIIVNKNNEMIAYKNDTLTKVDDNFLLAQKKLQKLDLPSVKRVGRYAFFDNKDLEEINMPLVKEIDNGFLAYNKKLDKLSLPNLQNVNDDFLTNNIIMKELDLPKLKSIGRNFMSCNITIEKIDFPHLEQIKGNFFRDNFNITNVYLPKLMKKMDNLYEDGIINKKIYLKLKTKNNKTFN